MSLLLTKGQQVVLRAAASVRGVKKGEMPGRLWRNFDQLEKRGLVRRLEWGRYEATPDGCKIVERIYT